MKRFITAMLFSLTVIVCEQPTLFAALSVYTNVASVTGSPDVANSLKVKDFTVDNLNDRLIPLAGGSQNGFVRYPPLVKPNVNSVYDDTFVVIFGHAPDCRPSGGRFDSSSQTSQAILPNIVDPDDCPSVVDDMPFFEFFDIDHGNAYSD